jgi:hypothetical protein
MTAPGWERSYFDDRDRGLGGGALRHCDQAGLETVMRPRPVDGGDDHHQESSASP